MARRNEIQPVADSGRRSDLAVVPQIDHRAGEGLAANDALAIGVLAGLRQAGRRVPEDIALVGLGDLQIGRLITPSLSTVRIDGEAIGQTAGRLTASQEGPRRIDLGFTLLTRHTG